MMLRMVWLLICGEAIDTMKLNRRLVIPYFLETCPFSLAPAYVVERLYCESVERF